MLTSFVRRPRLEAYLQREADIAPLAVFRVLFGAVTLYSTARFIALGWIEDQYLAPRFHFTYYGFEWVRPFDAAGMYTVFVLMLLASLGVMLGLFYRASITVFFLAFTYVELLDKTYYLNHYYFVSVVGFLLTLSPAHRAFSLDTLRKPELEISWVKRWEIDLFKLQIGIVYCFAGVVKINGDWLLHALPLRIWLPAHDALPVIGGLLRYAETAFVFSWAGMAFDTTVPFFLLWSRTRSLAYVAVIVFHTVTGLLFQIGVFPLVMIFLTPIFFSEAFHRRVIDTTTRWVHTTTRWVHTTTRWVHTTTRWVDTTTRWVDTTTRWVDTTTRWLGKTTRRVDTASHRLGKASHPLGFNTSLSAFSPPVKNALPPSRPSRLINRAIPVILIVHFTLQVLVPWRFLLYPGNVFWTEEGYRFAWRVMLMEKAGTATFYIKDAHTGREGEVVNSEFLNAHQEKQMSMQPDMILQFAHFLRRHYEAQGIHHPEVRAEVYVTLNARPSQLLLDPYTNLAAESDGFFHYTWLLPFAD